jgi:cellular nucleic acid-binding protein
MARGKSSVVVQAMAPNPYASARDIQPLKTTCEICERTIFTKDWPAHKNSKAHRKLEDDIKDKENAPAAGSNFTGGDWTGGESSGLNATDNWGDVGFTDGTNDGGFTSGGGATRGGL